MSRYLSKRMIVKGAAMLAVVLVLTVCKNFAVALREPTPAPTPSPVPTPIPIPQTIPTPAPELNDHYVYRFDPDDTHLRVLYEPDNPRQVSLWAADHPSAVVINAGFFHYDYESSGLLIKGGEVFGESFDQFEDRAFRYSGMFSQGGDGMWNFRFLSGDPYQPGEDIQQALQGVPMMIEDGEPVRFRFSETQARRTVIGRDADGMFVVVIFAQAHSLAETRQHLLTLEGSPLVDALNLDGGTSTGIVIPGPDPAAFVLDSARQVPSVLLIEPSGE